MFTIYKLGTISQKGKLLELVGIRKTIIKSTYIKIITKLWRNVPCTCSKLWLLAWGNPWCRRELEEIRRKRATERLAGVACEVARGYAATEGAATSAAPGAGRRASRRSRSRTQQLSYPPRLHRTYSNTGLFGNITCRWLILCYPSVVGKIKVCYPQELYQHI